MAFHPPGAPPPPWGVPPMGAPQAPGAPPKPITGSPHTLAMHALELDPRTGLPVGERPPAGTAAVVAFTTGILLCLGPPTGLTAIIAGVVALRSDDPAIGGRRLAVAGLALGVLNLALSALYALYWLLA